MQHHYINNSGYNAFIKALLLILLALTVAGFAGCDKGSLIPPKEKELWVEDLTYDLPEGWVWKGNAGEHHNSAFYGEMAPPTDFNDDNQPFPVSSLSMHGAEPGTEEDAKKAMIDNYNDHVNGCDGSNDTSVITEKGGMSCTLVSEDYTSHVEYKEMTIAGVKVFVVSTDDLVIGAPGAFNPFAFVKDGKVVQYILSGRIEDNIDVLENLITTLRFNKVLKDK